MKGKRKRKCFLERNTLTLLSRLYCIHKSLVVLFKNADSDIVALALGLRFYISSKFSSISYVFGYVPGTTP